MGRQLRLSDLLQPNLNLNYGDLMHAVLQAHNLLQMCGPAKGLMSTTFDAMMGSSTAPYKLVH
jgi:hypothetical protein